MLTKTLAHLGRTSLLFVLTLAMPHTVFGVPCVPFVLLPQQNTVEQQVDRCIPKLRDLDPNTRYRTALWLRSQGKHAARALPALFQEYNRERYPQVQKALGAAIWEVFRNMDSQYLRAIAADRRIHKQVRQTAHQTLLRRPPPGEVPFPLVGTFNPVEFLAANIPANRVATSPSGKQQTTNGRPLTPTPKSLRHVTKTTPGGLSGGNLVARKKPQPTASPKSLPNDVQADLLVLKDTTNNQAARIKACQRLAGSLPKLGPLAKTAVPLLMDVIAKTPADITTKKVYGVPIDGGPWTINVHFQDRSALLRRAALHTLAALGRHGSSAGPQLVRVVQGIDQETTRIVNRIKAKERGTQNLMIFDGLDASERWLFYRDLITYLGRVKHTGKTQTALTTALANIAHGRTRLPEEAVFSSIPDTLGLNYPWAGRLTDAVKIEAVKSLTALSGHSPSLVATLRALADSQYNSPALRRAAQSGLERLSRGNRN